MSRWVTVNWFTKPQPFNRMTSHQIIETIETLMETNLKMARRHDLEEIKISAPRAKMILDDIRAYKTEQKASAWKKKLSNFSHSTGVII